MMPDVSVLERVSRDLNDDGDYFSPASANVTSGTDVAKEGVFSVDSLVKTTTRDLVPETTADTDVFQGSGLRTQCLDPAVRMTDEEVLAFSQTLQESILDEVRGLAEELEAAQRLHAPDSPAVIPPPSQAPSQSAAGVRGGAGVVPPGSPLSVELQGALGRLKHDLSALQSVSPLARSLLSGGKRAGVRPPPAGLIVMRQLEDHKDASVKNMPHHLQAPPQSHDAPSGHINSGATLGGPSGTPPSVEFIPFWSRSEGGSSASPGGLAVNRLTPEAFASLPPAIQLFGPPSLRKVLTPQAAAEVAMPRRTS